MLPTLPRLSSNSFFTYLVNSEDQWSKKSVQDLIHAVVMWLSQGTTSEPEIGCSYKTVSNVLAFNLKVTQSYLNIALYYKYFWMHVCLYYGELLGALNGYQGHSTRGWVAMLINSYSTKDIWHGDIMVCYVSYDDSKTDSDNPSPLKWKTQ